MVEQRKRPSTESLRAPDRRWLYEQLAARLLDYVEISGLAVGDRLPSERDLAQALQVSRASVRQATVALEVSGTLEVRHGDGIYLRARPANGTHVMELMQRRHRLPDAAGACDRRVAPQLARRARQAAAVAGVAPAHRRGDRVWQHRARQAGDAPAPRHGRRRRPAALVRPQHGPQPRTALTGRQRGADARRRATLEAVAAGAASPPSRRPARAPMRERRGEAS